MRKLITFFGLLNLLFSLAIMIAFIDSWRFRHYGNYVICLAELLFLGAGIGLFARNKIGWALTVIMNSFTISIAFTIAAILLLAMVDNFTITLALAVFLPFAIIDLAILSLMHMQRADFREAFQINARLKRVTVILSLLVPVVMGGWIYLIIRYGKEFAF